MKPNQTNSKWWLAAILLPVFAIIGGIFFAYGAPHNQSDWFGGAFLGRLFLGLLIGCVLSIVAAAISLAKRERFCVVALLAGIPSLIFVVNVCVAIPKAAKDAKRANEGFLAHQKQVEEQETRILNCRDEFRANPSLITSDDFWNAQTNQDRSAQDGLDRLIEDQSFSFTPQISEYILKRFPGRTEELSQNKRLNHDELIKIINDVQNPQRVRETAVYVLISDRFFEVTDEWKKCVFYQYPNEIGKLLYDERLTKSEIEALIADPKIPDYVKEDAQSKLKIGWYKTESSRAK
jgi:hypothetical protein